MFSTDHITHNSKKKTERLEVVTAFRKYNIFMCAKEYWTQNILSNCGEFFEGANMLQNSNEKLFLVGESFWEKDLF